MTRQRAVIFLAVLVAFGTWSGAMAQVSKDESAAASAVQPNAPFYRAMTVMGMQVWIDPETGQMRQPTPEEAAELAAGMQRIFAAAAPAPVPTYHENGMVSLALDPGLMDFSVVQLDSDGSLRFDCVDGSEQARSLVESAPDVAAAEER